MIGILGNHMTWVKMQNPEWYNMKLPDGGPVYMETDPNHLIVEPWNAISSLLILVPALIWLWKIRKDPRHYPFLLFTIPLIITGGIGSTIFHGFRISPVFLYMDIVPSAILTLSISIFFWLKVLPKWWQVFFIILPAILVRLFFWNRLPTFVAINLSYFISGFMVALPLLIILFLTKFAHWGTVVLAVVFFAIALACRQADSERIRFLSMGTHFLWHAFSAAGTYYVLTFIYHLRHMEVGKYRKKDRHAYQG